MLHNYFCCFQVVVESNDLTYIEQGPMRVSAIQKKKQVIYNLNTRNDGA